MIVIVVVLVIMIVNGREIHQEFSSHETTHKTSKRCQKVLAALSKQETISLDAIGSRSNNLLLEVLKCQSKVLLPATSAGTSSGGGGSPCKKVEKSYQNCHASVMGTGNFKGKKQCGEELGEWLDCVRSAS